ncbi:MAG: hypothetical protein R3B57_04715 [Phycisphaerales bacterium]
MRMKSGFCFSAAMLVASTGAAFAEPTAPAVISWDHITVFPNVGLRGGETLGDGVHTVWDNGPCDWNNAPDSAAGVQSQVWPGVPSPFEARVADDFFIRDCEWWSIEKITVIMAISDNITSAENLDIKLQIWSDCDGRPDAIQYEFPIQTTVEDDVTTIHATMLGAGTGLFEDTNFWEICFDPEINPDVYGKTCPLFLTGDTRYWVSPIGGSNGVYYWTTANDYKVQGVQAQFKSPHLGFPNWIDVDDIPSGKVDCQDMCFTIDAKVCCLLRDQGIYDLAGLPSLDFPSTSLFSSRSADQFQIPPGADQVLCRVEAYVATNCFEDHTFFFEVWDNLCDCPVPGTARRVDMDKAYLTGETFGGLDVYCFAWSCPDVTLQAGCNYWFAVAGQGTGVAGERAVFLFKAQEDPCDIYIREGKYKNKFFGYEDFTPVSLVDGGPGEPREFAFRMWTRDVEDAAPGSTTSGSMNISGGEATNKGGAPVSRPTLRRP